MGCLLSWDDGSRCYLQQSSSKPMPTGIQVAYIMDVLRYREGALGAIWITLGLANLSMLVSEVSFGGSNPIILSAAISLCSGSTLFLVGESALHWSPMDRLLLACLSWVVIAAESNYAWRIAKK